MTPEASGYTSQPLISPPGRYWVGAVRGASAWSPSEVSLGTAVHRPVCPQQPRLHGLESQISGIAWSPEHLCCLWGEVAGSLRWDRSKEGIWDPNHNSCCQKLPTCLHQGGELAFSLEARSHPESSSLSTGSISFRDTSTVDTSCFACLIFSHSSQNTWIFLGGPPSPPLSFPAV